MLLMPGDEKISRFQAHHLIQHFAFLRMCLYPTRYSHSLFVSVPTLTGRHRTGDTFRAIRRNCLDSRYDMIEWGAADWGAAQAAPHFALKIVLLKTV